MTRKAPIASGVSKIGALLATLMLALTGIFVSALPASAQVSYDDPRDLDRVGVVFPDGWLWLGTQVPTSASDGWPAFCIQGWELAPAGTEQVISITDIPSPTHRIPGLELTTAQAAYLLEKYSFTDDSITAAALSLLVHANFEEEPTGTTPPVLGLATADAYIAYMIAQVRSEAPQIETKAKELQAEALASHATGYDSGVVEGDGERTGKINGIQVTNTNGDLIAGRDVTLTLDGPAVFDETGTNTWTGKTQSTPLSLAWTATGNGEVSYVARYKAARNTLQLITRDGEVQKTLTYGDAGESDPATVDGQELFWKVVYDFQPAGVSHTDKITDTGTFVDTFDAQADPDYGSGTWMTIDGTDDFVPVDYTVTAYYTGSTPPSQSAEVPAGAEVLGHTTVTANGPGEISAEFTSTKPGFVTIVWEVVKAEQEYSDYIAGDWADGYGLADETVSHRYEAQIDSMLSIRETKAGAYFVDDVWITGLPTDHTLFAGVNRFAGDEKTISHEVLFFPEGLEVIEANRDKAEKIGSRVEIPAKNGFYPSVGDTSWLMKTEPDGRATRGTYVFTSSFAGDDRVKPLTTSVEDVYEQFTVTGEPALHTTLMYENTKTVPAYGKRILTDMVAYTDLEVGKTYEVEGTLMDKETGEPLVDADGKAITASSTITAESPNGSVEVTFEIDASLYQGKTIVAFEELFEDGRSIAIHADINDENQTVTVDDGVKLKTTATDTADGDKILIPSKTSSITDVVCDEKKNLRPGTTYTIVTDVVKQSSGETVLTEKVTTEFTPESADDCAAIVIEFDGSDLAGQDVVVFEDIYDGEELISVHHDLNDKDQTVSFEAPQPPGSRLAKTGLELPFLGGLAASAATLGLGLLLMRRKFA